MVFHSSTILGSGSDADFVGIECGKLSRNDTNSRKGVAIICEYASAMGIICLRGVNFVSVRKLREDLG